MTSVACQFFLKNGTNGVFVSVLQVHFHVLFDV